MSRYFWSWKMRRRPAFPTTPVTTDKRIPKIYNWIETCFWPKLTPDQRREMLPFFKRIKFGKSTEIFGNHWLGTAARSPNSSPMIKVLVHAIWGEKAERAVWWDEYHKMFGHLEFPEGSVPGVTFFYDPSGCQGSNNPPRQARMNNPATKSKDNAATQNGTTVVPPALQAIPESAPEICLSDKTVRIMARIIAKELRQPIDALANQMDTLQRQLTLVTDRVNLATDKVDSVQQQVRQQQIEDGNKMDAMHRQLTLVVQKQIED